MNSLRYEDFAAYVRDVEKMQNDVDKVQQVDTLQVRDTPADPLQGKRLRDFSGFTFFTLGACYETVRIEHDIVGAYDAETPEKFTLLTHHFQLPILAGKEWSCVLQGMETPVFENFKAWVELVRIRRPGTAAGSKIEFWQMRDYPVAVQDPLAREERTIAGADPVIHVFAPAGLEYTLVPEIAAGILPVRFARAMRDPLLLREAEGAFGHPVTEAEYLEFQRTGKVPL